MSKMRFVTPLVVSFGIIYLLNQKCRNESCKYLLNDMKLSSKKYYQDNKYLLGIIS